MNIKPLADRVLIKAAPAVADYRKWKKSLQKKKQLVVLSSPTLQKKNRCRVRYWL